ncbi:SGNH/GDSL hydrolase family protein [Kutzneria viridogrisea]|uniref:SGNH hydrolase-type esterase domain-containing protein n=2 Tax=Kutzneria TaxID=43356 RepID=W5WI62_9PSEU|nr:SGNH/GDSL hydrolase family protein [Kutzneria albida]AHI00272.1 hypothetical protein KALB_6913 [Kutzneria albida DSM 43870]MBA8925448.1 lysophospholipase L1-like esterase [Kutzneria viridogrisea]
MGEYTRYVALGDSQTEGIGDGDELSGYRGFADRLAEQIAASSPGLLYANLAVRGRLAGEVRAEQLAPALALRPDVATVIAGLNDVMRPKFDAAQVASDLEAMFAGLTGIGARVASVTFPDIARIAPVARSLRPRVLELNARIREAAARHGVALFEAFPYSVTTDLRIWSADRIHASPLGHARIAAGLAHALDLPGSDDSWRLPLPGPAPATTVVTELRWLGGFLGPWLWRRVRGVSSGDGRVAKRPDLTPLTA